MESYLNSVVKQFEYYKSLGDKTLAQLDFTQINFVSDSSCNGISSLVKHISGNMLSRWTNFLTEDGEKSWRNRDDEFEPTYNSKEDLIKHWNKGWDCLFKALTPLTTDDLETIVYIRNQGHTVVEAINRQLCHYAYHVGQMVYQGKLVKGDSFKTLSIAKGQSKSYNADKFNKEKNRSHFTDDL